MLSHLTLVSIRFPPLTTQGYEALCSSALEKRVSPTPWVSVPTCPVGRSTPAFNRSHSCRATERQCWVSRERHPSTPGSFIILNLPGGADLSNTPHSQAGGIPVISHQSGCKSPQVCSRQVSSVPGWGCLVLKQKTFRLVKCMSSVLSNSLATGAAHIVDWTAFRLLLRWAGFIQGLSRRTSDSRGERPVSKSPYPPQSISHAFKQSF